MSRIIEFEEVERTVESLCESLCYELPPDVLEGLKQAAKKESSQRAVKILEQLIENARIAAQERIPLCQDTGLAVVFVELGSEVVIRAERGKTIIDAINLGAAGGYKKGYLRNSVVAEPLRERKNTGSNTPAIVHLTIAAGDRLKITVMAKGGGCENKSQFKMFRPTAQRQEVIDWVVEVAKEAGADACPPFIVGVGIGGDFEYSCLLSKKALLRKLGQRNSDRFYAELEEDLLSAINALDIGPQGLGGVTTALDCMVEAGACHIASLPVAVNIECHSHRHKSAVI